MTRPRRPYRDYLDVSSHLPRFRARSDGSSSRLFVDWFCRSLFSPPGRPWRRHSAEMAKGMAAPPDNPVSRRAARAARRSQRPSPARLHIVAPPHRIAISCWAGDTSWWPNRGTVSATPGRDRATSRCFPPGLHRQRSAGGVRTIPLNSRYAELGGEIAEFPPPDSHMLASRPAGWFHHRVTF